MADTRSDCGLLDQLLRGTDVAIEFRAGRSTPWIAQRVGKLTSVEDNEEWFRRVSNKLSAAGITNVDLIHRPRGVADVEGMISAYVHEFDRFADRSLDFVLIDGMYRGHCAIRAMSKVKPGSLIVIDNTNWFLPSSTHSPASRAADEPPLDETWQEFADFTRDWRRLLTSNGVFDTLFAR